MAPGILDAAVVCSVRANDTRKPAVSLAGVVLPLERTKVGEFVPAATFNRRDVVNLPSVLRVAVAVMRPAYPSAALVLTPFVRVVGDDGWRS